MQPVSWDHASMTRANFISMVHEQGKLLYRDLPWRGLNDAYAVLVSEVMLQQTQVKRVLSYWERFMKMFPTLDALAAASNSDVLNAWQGLGYNRRALALKKTADMCSLKYQGSLPHEYQELLALPGIGSATAAGVCAFAYNKPACYIETNVRSVFIHYLFSHEQRVTDAQLMPYVIDVCPAHPRMWYYALLDIGAQLKKTTNPARKSAHYTRQSAFEGSRREKRSFVLKLVLAQDEGITRDEVKYQLNSFEKSHKRDVLRDDDMEHIIDAMIDEGFFKEHDGLLVL